MLDKELFYENKNKVILMMIGNVHMKIEKVYFEVLYFYWNIFNRITG